MVFIRHPSAALFPSSAIAPGGDVNTVPGPATTGDSGVFVEPTARLAVFATGMPATTTADTGVASSTAARPDTCNPGYANLSNPPSAPVDIGSS